MFYTFITNKKENLILDNNPFILNNKLDTNQYESNQIALIDGLEYATSLYKSEARFDDNKIKENVYWVENDYKRNEKIIQFIYDDFIKEKYNRVDIGTPKELNEILSEIDENKLEYIFYIDEIVKKDDLNLICFAIKYENKTSNIFYFIDLNFINYFESTKIDSFNSLLDITDYSVYTKYAIRYKHIRPFLRQKGLVTKTYELSNIIDFIKGINNDHLYEILLFLFVDFLNKNYDDIEINSSDVNLLKVEAYLSNIYITSIDVLKYPSLIFPQRKYGIKYNYNGSYNVTGRIYATDLDKSQALQSLPKDKKDILNAEENCVLIEYDYKSAEFDILLQLCNIKYDEETDLHFKTINQLLKKEITELYTYDEVRSIGKKINYALIYGMELEKVFDTIIYDFKIQDKEVKYEIMNNLLNWELIEKVEKFKEGLFIEKVDEINKLLRNYFDRYIKYNKTHAILNNYIQSTVVDLICIKMCKIIKLIRKNKFDRHKNKIILQNHDSILLQLEEDLLKETMIFDEITDIMNEKENDLKGRIRISYGKNWKFLKELN